MSETINKHANFFSLAALTERVTQISTPIHTPPPELSNDPLILEFIERVHTDQPISLELFSHVRSSIDEELEKINPKT